MHKDLTSLGYGNIPLLKFPEEASGNSRLGQTYAPLRWNFLGPEPSLYYRKERVESEAEIGSSEFRAGEFTCGFIER
ncbi:hypothetical protein K9M06_01605 [Candidatus Bipolaricaulota bacterium]|nr:hypothetical protein [Candidatus Bipolaricaulota bacterium]